MAIDIGSDAINRNRTDPWLLYTLIDKANPANATGTITSVELWCFSNLTGCMVGTFYLTGYNQLKCRASATIGNVTAGSKQTFGGLSIAVVTGDYIGIYSTTGGIEWNHLDAGVQLWYISGQYIDPGDETTYSLFATSAISVYGTGGGVAIPPFMHHYKMMRG